MIERTGEVSVPNPEVRRNEDLRAAIRPQSLVVGSLGLRAEQVLESFGLPYELDELPNFPEYRHVATETALKHLGMVWGNSSGDNEDDVEQVEYARYAARTTLTIEAVQAKTGDERLFLIEAIDIALEHDSRLRPLFAYSTEDAVDKVLVEDEAKAADLLLTMINCPGEHDGWSPIIDWHALKAFGLGAVDWPIMWVADGDVQEFVPSDADETMRDFFEPPFPPVEPGTEFVTSHNQDVAAMQRWAELFAWHPVGSMLTNQLNTIEMLLLTSENPWEQWAYSQSKKFAKR